MTSNAATELDEFFPCLREAEQDAVAQPPLQFPVQKDRVQDLVLNLLVRGEPYEEIAKLVSSPQRRYTAEEVKKIARSEWATKELSKRVVEAKDEDEDTLGNLLRIQTFDAIAKVGKLMECGHKPTELNACKLIFQYTLRPPTVDGKQKVTSDLPTTPEAIRDEIERLDRSIREFTHPNEIS